VNGDDNAIWRGIESRLEHLEDIIRELDEILRGDRKRKIVGLLAEWDRHDHELRKLNAVVFVDSTGKRGLAHDVDYLMDRRSGQERREQFKWGFWTAIAVALISSTTMLLTNWEKVQKILPKQKLSPLEKKIERAKHPTGKKIYKVRIIPATAPSQAKEAESEKASSDTKDLPLK